MIWLVGTALGGDLGPAPPPNDTVNDLGVRYGYSESKAWEDASNAMLFTVPAVGFVPTSGDLSVWPEGMAASGSAFLVSGFLAYVGKKASSRPRPYWEAGQCPTESADGWECDLYGTVRTIPEHEVRASFPSGHTALVTASTAAWVTRAWLDDSADRNVKIGGTIAGAVLSVGTGVARVGAGRHHVSDVATGFLIGGLVGVTAPLVVDQISQPGQR